MSNYIQFELFLIICILYFKQDLGVVFIAVIKRSTYLV